MDTPSKPWRSMAIAALVLAGAFTAKADQVWNYQGTVMQPCNCALSGSMTLDTSGNATSWDFLAAGQELNTTDSHFFVQLDTLANFYIMVQGQDGYTFGSYFPNFGDPQILGSEFVQLDYNLLDSTNMQGVWSDPVATPEPSTFILLVAGLGAVALRRKKRVDTSVWEPLA